MSFSAPITQLMIDIESCLRSDDWQRTPGVSHKAWLLAKCCSDSLLCSGVTRLPSSDQLERQRRRHLRDVEICRKHHQFGLSVPTLAEHYDLSQRTIQRILTRGGDYDDKSIE